MRRYLIRRLIQVVVMLVVMSVVFFVLIHLLPGGPEKVFFSPRTPPEARAHLIQEYGLDKPLPIQYFSYITQVVQGNFGNSIADGQPVLKEIGALFPNTLELFISAFFFALIIAIPLGVLAAVRQYSITDYTVTVLAYFGISMPIFFFGLVLQNIFGDILHVFPTIGIATPNADFGPLGNFEDRLVHLVMPTIVLSLLFIACWSRYLRSSMLDVVKQDYVRTARAKGLSGRVVFFRHALRNALIPLLTQLAIDFGAFAGGAAITETVFGWPGVGKFFIESLEARDYPVLMALLLITTSSVLIFNLIADLLYGVVDPRIRYS
jgi:peptide/nickel transport system permease protein